MGNTTIRKPIYLVLIGLTLFSACAKDEEEIPTEIVESYSFYIAGHTYGSPGVDNVGLHPPFREFFDYINSVTTIDFGVFTGDIVLMCTEQNWDEVDSDIALLNHSVHFAAGNHDLTDRDLFEARYGQTYSSFMHKGDLFITLDPNLDQWNISGDQLTFLQKTLTAHASNSANIYVFFHQLIWWSPDNEFQNVELNSTEGRASNVNFWEEVEPLFSSLSNQVLMFAGDIGARDNGSEFMYYSYSNITLVASGMGGGVRDNFVIIDVNENREVSFRLIAINGENMNSLGELVDYELP